MHDIDIEMVEMTLDVVKYAINRITKTNPELGKPKTESELRLLVGETVTDSGIGGEKAFQLFRDVLVKATVPIDHPRHLAFVPAAPTRGCDSVRLGYFSFKHTWCVLDGRGWRYFLRE